MGTRFTLNVPEDYVLRRDACSYGYIVLAPNHWDVPSQTLSRVLSLESGATRVRIAQGKDGGTAGAPLRVVCDRALDKPAVAQAKRQLARMLRLDESASEIAEYHKVDRRFKRSGRGRLFRSPSLFEDIIKTVTSCNVAWPSTVHMNVRLCQVLGERASARANEERPGLCPHDHAFPNESKLGRARPQTLRARCRAGYRDARMVELGKLFSPRRGREAERRTEWFEDPATPDDALHDALLSLPGIGPYAAANIMQLLGRYHRLPLDSESLRHGRNVLGYEGTDRQVLKMVHEHYLPFGRHAFRSYWFELWAFYESKAGPAWTWERERVAATFTASNLKKA